MVAAQLADGVAHKMPADLKKALLSNKKASAAWKSLTPLARNEWICWTVSVKQQKTRDEHVKRTVRELMEGKRRPCCWMGCVHRQDKPLNRSQRFILKKKSV